MDYSFVLKVSSLSTKKMYRPKDKRADKGGYINFVIAEGSGYDDNGDGVAYARVELPVTVPLGTSIQIEARVLAAEPAEGNEIVYPPVGEIDQQ